MSDSLSVLMKAGGLNQRHAGRWEALSDCVRNQEQEDQRLDQLGL